MKMTIEDLEARVRRLLEHGVPPGNTESEREWKRQVLALGTEVIPILFNVMERGPADNKYEAAIALRLFGYEAWKDISREPPVWQVRKNGNEGWREFSCSD